MDRVSIHSKQGMSIMENGVMASSMAKANIFSEMEVIMMGILLVIEEKAREHMFIIMGISTKENGLQDLSKVSASTLRMENHSKEGMKMEKDYILLMMKSDHIIHLLWILLLKYIIVHLIHVLFWVCLSNRMHRLSIAIIIESAIWLIEYLECGLVLFMIVIYSSCIPIFLSITVTC